ncbi:MAG: RtcB family protein [archaeon]
MKEKLQKINDYEWLLPRDSREGMNVAAKIIANKHIIDSVEDSAVEQLTNVACLPGIVEPVVGLPDMHWGYGLPMGAVSAFDAETGVISSGLCGFDINCGINSIATNLTADEVRVRIKELVAALFNTIPCGVGSKSKLRVDDLDQVLTNGCSWAVENGYGVKEDLERIEERGCMEGGDPAKVSELAKKRGRPQLGTLGAGNHFLEVQRVDEIYDADKAKEWGIEKDQALIMVHCGSRGLGHQVASDYLKIQEKAVQKYGIKLPDRQLACAPANSPEGRDYFSAMKCAVNYSFTNRLVMTHWIRETFEKVFKKDWEGLGMNTIWALAHNVVKQESYKIDGEKREVYVHRKGSTRSFPDQPVLLAGSMGTASYILKGTEAALEKTFGSSAHGSGRAMSRHEALRRFKGEKISHELFQKQGIVTKSPNWKSLAEEAPLAYKPSSEVVDSVHGAGISLKVVRVSPMAVCKG